VGIGGAQRGEGTFAWNWAKTIWADSWLSTTIRCSDPYAFIFYSGTAAAASRSAELKNYTA
jgi:hypothetical protein